MPHRTLRRPVRREIAQIGDIKKQVSAALALSRRGRRAAALGTFARLREQYPTHAPLWLESAMELDRRGREAEAIPIYKKALHLGLQGPEFRDALVCLASSLRNVGRADEAAHYLQRARKRFPNDVVVKLFLALCYHDLGRTAPALRLVAMTCLDESHDRALEAYRGALGRKYLSLGRRR